MRSATCTCLVLLATQAFYGVNFYADSPVDFVARIAPRPILFIHGAADKYIPPSNMDMLAAAARSSPNADVQTWSVPGANHAQSFNIEGKVYVDRIIESRDTSRLNDPLAAEFVRAALGAFGRQLAPDLAEDHA